MIDTPRVLSPLSGINATALRWNSIRSAAALAISVPEDWRGFDGVDLACLVIF